MRLISTWRRGGVGWGHFSAVFGACLMIATPALATEVGLVGLFPGKAVLIINGSAPRTLSIGSKLNDVKLIAVEQDAATLEFDGKRQRLLIGQHVVSSEAATQAGQTINLTADPGGHFTTIGTVNGATMRFLVDTGASFISLGASDARRANIDLNKAQPGMSMTANGPVPVWRVKLNTVKVGDVTLNDVDAAVHNIDLPVVLLGMSFLSRMEMKRDGETMTLRKRY